MAGITKVSRIVQICAVPPGLFAWQRAGGGAVIALALVTHTITDHERGDEQWQTDSIYPVTCGEMHNGRHEFGFIKVEMEDDADDMGLGEPMDGSGIAIGFPDWRDS